MVTGPAEGTAGDSTWTLPGRAGPVNSASTPLNVTAVTAQVLALDADRRTPRYRSADRFNDGHGRCQWGIDQNDVARVADVYGTVTGTDGYPHRAGHARK